MSGGGLALFYCPWSGEVGVCGNEVADELISSDVTEPQHYGSHCVYMYKAGWCVRQVIYTYSLLMRANKLEAVQELLTCLAPQ